MIYKILSTVLLSALLLSCSKQDDTTQEGGLSVKTLADSVLSAQQREGAALTKQDSLKNDTLAIFFRKYGVEGSFLLHDAQKQKYYKHRIEWHKKPMSPASTFKVLNALIALESGAIPNTKTVIKWDGVQRRFPHWNKDHDMETAMKGSVVWYFQEVARRIGKKRMQHYINEVGYGNRNIGENIDKFWLDSTLLVTMEDQVSFMRSLNRDALPFSSNTMRSVKNMLTIDQKSTYTLRGKTGWAMDLNPQVGWLVGYVVTHPEMNSYYFATAIHIKRPEDAALRETITVEILKHLKIMREPAPVPDTLQQVQDAKTPVVAPKDAKAVDKTSGAKTEKKVETKPVEKKKP